MPTEPLGSILGAIGATPLVALDRLAAGLPGRVLAKIEAFNPGASIKDRVALRIIEHAERSSRLQPGTAVVELTSGNMGVGLAVVCAIKGYRLIAVMSEGNSIERRQMLAALGAEVDLVAQAGEPRPGQVSGEDLELVEARTQELVRKLDAFRPDQFNNQEGPRAHELTTGPEIWQQTGGRLDYFVAAVGTGGTFIGTSRYLKSRDPRIRCFAVEPASAPALAGGPITNTSHHMQGAGYALRPPLWDDSLCDVFLTVSDDELKTAARDLARREGIFAGASSGANVAASLRLAREVEPGQVIVTVLPDTGLKYLSTDVFG